MLKLVYTNSNPISANQSSTFSAINSCNIINSCQPTSSPETILASFLPHFTAKTCLRDSHFYTMTARDLSHFLSCELALEIRESEDESEFGDVICRFPVLQDEYLEAFVWEDTTLMALILVQFHMKILEQLLVFCANHNALKLVIHVDPLEGAPLEAYKEFAVHTDQIITHKGRMTALVIPTDKATYDKLIDHIDQIITDCREMLWEDQHNNPIIQQYLKLNKFS